MLSLLAVATVLVFSVKYGESAFVAAMDIPFTELGETTASAQKTLSQSSDTFAKSKKPKTESAAKTEPQTTVGNTSSAASKTQKSGKALGKIYGNFFSPYTANTAYNNIYLNNQSGVKIDIKNLLKGYSPVLDETVSAPQVLIYHTHASENYMTDDSDFYTEKDLARTADQSKNVVGIGNKLTEVLKERGISVLHDKTVHDDPSYNGSYYRSAATVEKYLKKYPSIKVAIDLHRDAIADGDDLVKPVAEINGKSAAQVMICVGSNTGSVDYYPNWKENLKFGLKLQQTLEVLYPGLARALFLASDRCYNQNLLNGAIIIEFGTNANTVSEAEYSATLVANALSVMLTN